MLKCSKSELSSEGWKARGKLERREGTFWVERTAPVLQQKRPPRMAVGCSLGELKDPHCAGPGISALGCWNYKGTVSALKTNFPWVDSIIILHSAVGPTLSI